MTLDITARLLPEMILPTDAAEAVLLGRVWRPDVGGPSVVTIRGGEVFDVSATFSTSSASSRLPRSTAMPV